MPKLRADLVVSDRPGAPTVIKNPETGRFFQIGPTERSITRLMDGTRSLEDLRASCASELKIQLDGATLQDFVTTLARADFLEIEKGHQGAFLEPTRPGSRLRPGRLVGNLLYWRFGFIKPDRFLTAAEPKVRFFFTPWFVVGAIVSIGGALGTVVAEWELLLSEVVRLKGVTGAALLWGSFSVIVVLHELAHGLTCKHFGGHVPRMGFLLMLLTIPCAFTDVSDAWLFPQKRRRLWVTLAGPFFEAFLWSLATFVWRVSSPETFVHHFALAIVAASGVTIVWDLNPLIKLDGYYLFSDLVGVPNLRLRSFNYLGHLLWEAVTGTSVVPAHLPLRRRLLYAAYGLGAMVYTGLMLAGITFYLGSALVEWLGATGVALTALLLALLLRKKMGVMTQGVANLSRAGGGFWRQRRVRILLLAATAAVAWGLAVRLDLRVAGEFILEPAEAREVSAAIPGFIKTVHVRQGDRVVAGQSLVTLDDVVYRANLDEARAALGQAQSDLEEAVRGPRLEARREKEQKVELYRKKLESTQKDLDRCEQLKKSGSAAFIQKEFDTALQAREVAQEELDLAKRELDLLLAGTSPELIEKARARVHELEVKVQKAQLDLTRTRLPAPIDGVVVTEYPDRLEGTQAVPDTPLLSLNSGGRIVVAVRLPEKELADVNVGYPVELKALSYPGKTFTGRVARIAPMVKPGDKAVLLSSHVLLLAEVEDPEGLLKPGMSGQARIICGRRTVLGLMTRRLVRWIRVEFWW